jgi:hypothetical protein
MPHAYAYLMAANVQSVSDVPSLTLQQAGKATISQPKVLCAFNFLGAWHRPVHGVHGHLFKWGNAKKAASSCLITLVGLDMVPRVIMRLAWSGIDGSAS